MEYISPASGYRVLLAVNVGKFNESWTCSQLYSATKGLFGCVQHYCLVNLYNVTTLKFFIFPGMSPWSLCLRKFLPPIWWILLVVQVDCFWRAISKILRPTIDDFIPIISTISLCLLSVTAFVRFALVSMTLFLGLLLYIPPILWLVSSNDILNNCCTIRYLLSSSFRDVNVFIDTDGQYYETMGQ